MKAEIEFLNHLYKDAEMGKESLENLLHEIKDKDNKIKNIAEDELKGYERYYKEIKKMLEKEKNDPKETGMIAKMSSSMGIKMEIIKDNSDARVADMLIQGFTMGATDLEKQIKKYDGIISKKLIDYGKDFLEFHENNIKSLKKFL